MTASDAVTGPAQASGLSEPTKAAIAHEALLTGMLSWDSMIVVVTNHLADTTGA